LRVEIVIIVAAVYSETLANLRHSARCHLAEDSHVTLLCRF